MWGKLINFKTNDYIRFTLDYGRHVMVFNGDKGTQIKKNLIQIINKNISKVK